MSQEKEIGRLEIESIRKAFPNEAHHFTTWMEQHIEQLAERLRIKLHVVQREKPVGAFTVDLLCEDGEGHAVIVENQLEQTNHDHLGKLLTYLVNLDAAAAIWVTSDPRPEHQKVIDWLNEATSADISFFLVKAEAVRVDASQPAPLFTIVAGPSPQIKEAGHEKKDWAERHFKRMEFWNSLLERSKDRTRLFANISPGREHWISMSAGKSGISFSYLIWMDAGGVELYIDHDHDTGKGNKLIFDGLHAAKDEIERDYGGPLDWQRLNDKRACRITARVTSGGLANAEKWPEIQDKMIDAMIRFHKAIRPWLDRVQV